MSKTAGCFTIVINQKGYILLAKRKDYPLWDLPGGTLEKGEDTTICAIRETEEETGYIISIKQKIGEYYKPQYNDVEHLFLGELEGGSPIDGGPETEEVKWFHPRKLPFYMIPNRRQQIRNYFKYKGEIVEKSLRVSPTKIFFFKGFLRAFGKFL
ncbi:NUDIX hydrolase [Rossellomorea sp. DUT-2]|uniref:NUDIX hydrolase n=1 Tax=Rossellomorea sp. DUT-2 TaxID=3412021 RepID=UPI003D165FF0